MAVFEGSDKGGFDKTDLWKVAKGAGFAALAAALTYLVEWSQGSPAGLGPFIGGLAAIALNAFIKWRTNTSKVFRTRRAV